MWDITFLHQAWFYQLVPIACGGRNVYAELLFPRAETKIAFSGEERIGMSIKYSASE